VVCHQARHLVCPGRARGCCYEAMYFGRQFDGFPTPAPGARTIPVPAPDGLAGIPSGVDITIEAPAAGGGRLAARELGGIPRPKAFTSREVVIRLLDAAFLAPEGWPKPSAKCRARGGLEPLAHRPRPLAHAPPCSWAGCRAGRPRGVLGDFTASHNPPEMGWALEDSRVHFGRVRWKAISPPGSKPAAWSAGGLTVAGCPASPPASMAGRNYLSGLRRQVGPTRPPAGGPSPQLGRR